jgi:hypothetical protein
LGGGIRRKTKMAKEKNKKGAYTNHKNQEKPVEVVEHIEEIPGDQLFPQTRYIQPIKEFDKPLVNVEEALDAWRQYQDLINALIKTNDIVVVNNVPKARKSGINKIARFFGYSVEIIRAYKEDLPDGGFVWRVWAKAIAPNGRFRVAGAACSSKERRFAHLEHDVLATAETRAKKRAIEELAGMGELELLEEENGNENNNKEIPIVEEEEKKQTLEEYAQTIPVADKSKIIVSHQGGDPLKWDEKLVAELEKKVNEKREAIIVYQREDGLYDYYTFKPITTEQKKYLEWFKENTRFNIPDTRRLSKDRTSRLLHVLFEKAKQKGIRIPFEIKKEEEPYEIIEPPLM